MLPLVVADTESFTFNTILQTPGYSFEQLSWHELIAADNSNGVVFLQAVSSAQMATWGSAFGVPVSSRLYARIDLNTGNYTIVSNAARTTEEWGAVLELNFGPLGTAVDASGQLWSYSGLYARHKWGEQLYQGPVQTVAQAARSSGEAFEGKFALSQKNGWYAWIDHASETIVSVNDLTGARRTVSYAGSYHASADFNEYIEYRIGDPTLFSTDGFDLYLQGFGDISSDGRFALVDYWDENATPLGFGYIEAETKVALVDFQTGQITQLTEAVDLTYAFDWSAYGSDWINGDPDLYINSDIQDGFTAFMSDSGREILFAYTNGLGFYTPLTGVIAYIPYVQVISGYQPLDSAEYLVNISSDGRSAMVQTTDDLVVIDLYGSHALNSVSGTSAANTLSGTVRVETILGFGGNDTITAQGGNDLVYGGTGHDILNGGTGNDSLVGGAGNDIYFVDQTGDRIFETTTLTSNVGAGGIDTVNTLVGLSLNASVGLRFVENLVLAGTRSINGSGNAFSNTITGNAGNNSLNGGAGHDRLSGRGGADSFVFSSALGLGNIDVITDYNALFDTIRLENAVFIGLAAGSLESAAFVRNETGNAADRSDRIIYETDTGRLYFDRDGSGVSARIHFVTLATDLGLNSGDFVVF